MKKILMTLSAIATLGTAVVLSSCDNAEEVKKQTEEQNAKIQAMVDEKLAGLQTEADAECAAMIEAMATAQYEGWVATEGKKAGVKPKPKTTTPAKKEESKPETVGDGKTKMGTGTSTTVGDGKPKMGETKKDSVGKGKPKMGTP